MKRCLHLLLHEEKGAHMGVHLLHSLGQHLQLLIDVMATRLRHWLAKRQGHSRRGVQCGCLQRWRASTDLRRRGRSRHWGSWRWAWSLPWAWCRLLALLLPLRPTVLIEMTHVDFQHRPDIPCVSEAKSVGRQQLQCC